MYIGVGLDELDIYSRIHESLMRLKRESVMNRTYKHFVNSPVNAYQLVGTFVKEGIEYVEWVQSNSNNELSRLYLDEEIIFNKKDYIDLELL
jgi:hypothetical protein